MSQQMGFNHQPFNTRFARMGDASERVFLSIWPKAAPFGLDRPDLPVNQMSLMQRTAPDYQLVNELIECMGIGRDATLKLKCEKAHGLLVWSHTIAPVELFVSDSYRRRWWKAPLNEWLECCYQSAEVDRFNDNSKLHWRLHADAFPTDPTPSPREN